MARYIEGFRANPQQNIYLDGFTRTGAGSILFFDAQTGADPVSAAGTRGLFVDSTSRLSYWNGTSAIRLTGAGGVATTWEGLYDVDNTFALTTGTWTITQSGAFAMLTLNKTNVGAGAVIAITNSGTGNDVTGNAGNWTVTAAGALTLASTAAITGAVTAPSIAAIGVGATLTADGNGAGGVNIGSTSTGAITLGRATTITTGGLTVTAGGVTVSAGQYAHTDTSNTAAGFILTNNTVTTFGVGGASTGVVLLRSTSLTTGSLLSLQLTEGTLVGGFYLRCFDVTGGANVFTLGEDGAVVITGADSTTMLTLTAGDQVITLGSFTITNDDDNAATFSVTNNTATTASPFVFAGSGVFTGTTTTSFLTLTASGLTSGTVMFAPAAALTTGRIFHATANAMTTGILLGATSTSAVLTSGQFLSFTWNPATYTGAGITSTGLVQIADSPTISTTVAGSHRDLQVVRTNTTAVAAITYTVSGSLVYIENAAPTVGAGSTLTDSAIPLQVLQSNTAASTGVVATFTQSAGAGGTNAVTITANSVTTSSGVFTVTANGLTTGVAALITSSGVITDAGALLSLTGSGLTTGTGILATFAGLTTGVGFSLTANAATTSTGVITLSTTGLTSGSSVLITGSGATLLVGGRCLEIAMGVATTGVGASITTTGVYTNVTTGLLNIVADSATTGQAIRVSMTGVTTGVGLLIAAGAGVYTGAGLFQITGSGATTGSVALISNSGIMVGAGKLVELVAAGATTATAVLDYTLAALTSGTAFRITANALTTGSCITLVSSLAGQTAGSVSYLACNNGAADVFSVGVEGHLEFRQSTAPTIVVTTANGITGASITAGSTDVVGNITTTGTSTGSSVLTVTFNQAYAVAPRVLIVPRNTAAAAPNTGNLMYVSASTTTTFTITFPASGTFAAAPSVDYWVAEMGS